MASTPTSGQWQNNASALIKRIKKTSKYQTFRIFANGKNDDARIASTLIVLFPRNVTVLSLKDADGITFKKGFSGTHYEIHGAPSHELHDSSINKNTDSHVAFKIRDLTTTEQFYVDIRIAPVDKTFGRKESISAFVYSVTPEKDKSSNYFVLSI